MKPAPEPSDGHLEITGALGMEKVPIRAGGVVDAEELTRALYRVGTAKADVEAVLRDLIGRGVVAGMPS